MSVRTSAMVQDLSQYHAPISDLFPAPSSPGEWAGYRLRDEKVSFYRENGYLAGIRLLTDQQCDVLCEQLQGLFDPQAPGHELFHEYHSNESSDPENVLFHALGHWRVAPAFHDLLWNPALSMAAAQLLDGPARFWHDQLFCKPARHGGVVAWHQDYSYWTRTRPMAHLTCWIGLDDATKENGCLHYVPDTHRWPLLPITGLANNMDAIQSVLSDEQKAQFHPFPVELKRGYATFHHPLLIHGSYENRSDRPRRAAVVNFFRDGVQSASDKPLLAGIPPISSGQCLGGQFFPLLLDPNRASRGE